MKEYLIYYLLYSFGFYSTVLCIAFPFVYPRIKFADVDSADEPLIITPFLRNGSIGLAQNLSIVNLPTKFKIESHAGFFTVNNLYNSNLFFWFFPSVSKNTKAPVVLWLQGGPGGSSLFGLFTELGPLSITKDGFKMRKYHWALENHLLFIDNPVGTGFSFTDDEKGYCSDEDCIAQALYSCLQQFFTLFPMLRFNQFFITGESYAGKYIPSLGILIHRKNLMKTQKKINLKGIAMGNAYCDPINQIDYGSYLYQHGMIDDNQLEIFMQIQTQISEAIKGSHWKTADILMDKLIDGELTNTSYFKNFTGFNYFYNFLKTDDDTDMTVFSNMLQNISLRNAIHVGSRPFNSGEEVLLRLVDDILKSVASEVSEMLSHYKVMVYNGQLDIIVAYPLTEKFLRNLEFSASEEYKIAPRKVWMVGDEIAGYVKKAGNLTEVLVRNAGHMVPHDQPKWAYDMITRFINDKFKLN